MESRTKGYFIAMSVLALVIIALVFLNAGKQISSAPEEILEDCKTLKFNDEEAINLVFFSPEEEAKEYSDYLIKSEPFDKYHDAFNFFFIDSYKPKCELYKGIAIYCHSQDLIKKAASCPYDYIAVLDEMESKIRSSVYQNVMSINTNHPKSVFLHEFGHAFANLAEEYAPARIPRGSKNCKTKCGKFEGEIDGCFHECSNSGHHRSIENGVMRTLATDDFGIYNDNLISNLIENSIPKDLQITGNAIKEESFTDCLKQEYILFTTEKQLDGTFKEISKTRERGCAPRNLLAGDYYYKIDEGEQKYFSNLVHAEGPISSENLMMEGVVEEIKTLSLAIQDTKKTAKEISLYDSEEDNALGEFRLADTGAELCQIN